MMTDLSPAPDNFLKIVRCKCKTLFVIPVLMQKAWLKMCLKHAATAVVSNAPNTKPAFSSSDTGHSDSDTESALLLSVNF